MTPISDWLRDHGLSEHIEAFEREAVTVEMLATLSDDDLKQLGLNTIATRLRFRQAIDATREQVRPTPVPKPDAIGELPSGVQDLLGYFQPVSREIVVASVLAGSVVLAGYLAGGQRSALLWTSMTVVLSYGLGTFVRATRLEANVSKARLLPAVAFIVCLVFLVGGGLSARSAAENLAVYVGSSVFLHAKYIQNDRPINVKAVLALVVSSAAYWYFSSQTSPFVALAETLGLVAGPAATMDIAWSRTADEPSGGKTVNPGVAFAPALKPLAALAMIAILGAGLTSTSSHRRRSSSSSAGSGYPTLTPSEAYSTLSGCCSGAGGRYSSSGQDCVIPSENVSAYEGCVGEFDVVFPSGNVEHMTGSGTVRPM